MPTETTQRFQIYTTFFTDDIQNQVIATEEFVTYEFAMSDEFTRTHFGCWDCDRIFRNQDRHPEIDSCCICCGDARLNNDRLITVINRRRENSRSIGRILTGLINGEIFTHRQDPLQILKFLGKPKDKLFYGVELELECPWNKMYALARRTNEALEEFGILKHDGSLNSGFEIVTAPATLEIHADRWRKIFNKLTFGERGLHDCERTGLHIHVSRKALSQFTIGKLLVFINDPKHKDKIAHIAGRIDNCFAQISTKKITDAHSKRKSRNRYEAINLTNEHTIEFRIFAATTDYCTLMMRLQFVAAVIAFCQQTSIKQLEWEKFEIWLSQNRKQYRYLHSFLNDLPIAVNY